MKSSRKSSRLFHIPGSRVLKRSAVSIGPARARRDAGRTRGRARRSSNKEQNGFAVRSAGSLPRGLYSPCPLCTYIRSPADHHQEI